MPKTTTEEKPAKKRTILTPAERIAKLKAEADALEAKEREKARGRLAQAEENVKALTARRDQAQAKLDDAITVAYGLRSLVGEPEQEPAPADS